VNHSILGKKLGLEVPHVQQGCHLPAHGVQFLGFPTLKIAPLDFSRS
jgi:hypothetical protein